jgi:hypothetical protein
MKSLKRRGARNRLILASILILASLLIGSLWGKSLMVSLIVHRELVAWIIALVTPSITGLYFKNRFFYLWVQRNLLLPFRNTHSDWEYVLQYKLSEVDSFTKARSFIKNLYAGSIKINNDLLNKFDYVVDQKTSFSLELSDIENELWLTLTSGKFTVPSYEYDEKLHEIVAYINDLENLLSPMKRDYSISIEFLEKNPYFGFLLQNLPPEYIKDFRLNISLPARNNAVITANKNVLTVNSPNVVNLQKVVTDYLSFSPNLTK